MIKFSIILSLWLFRVYFEPILEKKCSVEKYYYCNWQNIELIWSFIDPIQLTKQSLYWASQNFGWSLIFDPCNLHFISVYLICILNFMTLDLIYAFVNYNLVPFHFWILTNSRMLQILLTICKLWMWPYNVNMDIVMDIVLNPKS